MGTYDVEELVDGFWTDSVVDAFHKAKPPEAVGELAAERLPLSVGACRIL